MKILYVIDTFTSGGAEKTALLEASALNRLCDTVLLISNNYEAAEKFTDCKIYSIQRTKKFDLHYIIELRKYILEQKFTHIHFHSGISLFHFIFTFLSFSKIKIFFSHHGFIDKKNPKGVFDARLFFTGLFSSLFVTSNIAVSKYQLEDLKKCGIVRLKLLYNPVNDKFRYIDKALKLYEKDKIICGLTGNINKARDHYTVIRACKILIEKGYKIEIRFAGADVIGGDGVKNEIYRLGLENNIKLLGRVNNMQQFLSEIDMFIASSRYETFGISMIEALACGIPTLASDIPAYKELLNGNKFAYLFQCGNPEDLACKFEELLNDKVYINNMQNISNTVLEKFNIKKHLENLLDIYSA